MKEYKIEIGGRELIIRPNYLSEQANGSVIIQYGETVILTTATMSSEEKAGLGFFPLTVDYEEKFYAAGKIRGSRFSKREGRPTDIAVTSARLIDRSIRPRFPKEFKKETQIIATCLSWDGENDPDIISLLGASLSLLISDIPWNGPLGTVRVGRINGNLILNPTYEERKNSDINIVFAGFENDDKEIIVNMIEAGINEEGEDLVLDCLSFAKDHIKSLCDFQKSIAEEIGKEKLEINDLPRNDEFEKKVKDFLENKIEAALSGKTKTERTKEADDIKKELLSFVSQEYPSEEKESGAKEILEKEIAETVRKNILSSGVRPDGRHPDDLRELEAGVALLPRTHGSAIFSRGLTKSLSILTLGAPGDHQLLEGMEATGEKRFFHHYNFPPYSVGEVKPIRGPSRRDIGHGTLVEKALLPVIPDFEDFPYTIRIVSEILSSNGSTSMASVSSASLALMDAGVPIDRPVAGISLGIIQKDRDHKILVDIQGVEDHCGGMDLKVAGTREGLTAIQMDVKIDGITENILKEALEKGREARSRILDRIESVLNKPRESLSPLAPRVISFQINPEKIREVIGPGGKIINEIIGETGATIDIQDSGTVFVTSEKEEAAWKAVEWIKNIIREVEIGEIFQGKVKRIVDFGCFVEILPGQEGLVHVSKLADYHVQKVSDIVKVGDIIPVKVINIDDQGRINLSLKDAQNKSN